MHRRILEVACWLAAWIGTSPGAVAAAALPDPLVTDACPRNPQAIVERFIDADCDTCWSRSSTPAESTDDWVLDWIVPASRGEEAALAVAAIDEATDRLRRGGGPRPTANDSQRVRTTLRRLVPSLQVTSGPAWNGYIGVQIDSRGPWPAGSTAWMAIVELIPPLTDGTPVPRRLVRAVAGPLSLDGRRSEQQDVRAMRWPETARPERLAAAAWVEDRRGRIIAFAHGRCVRVAPESR